MKRFNLTAPLAALMLLASLAFTLALGGCSNSLSETHTEAASVPAEFGTVRVSALGAARTALPTAPTADYFTGGYTYTFAKSGATEAKTPDADGTFTLQAGSYTLTVKAYIDTVAEANLAAQGTSASFTVTAGATTPVTVTLSPIVDDGAGTLKYTLTFPVDATVTALTLTRIASDNTAALTAPASVVSATPYTANVGAGYWLLQAVLTKTGNDATAGMMEVVHIYANFETVAAYTFDDEEFRMPPANITNVADLTAYLETLPFGNAEFPSMVSLEVNVSNVWGAINTAVQNSGKYVILDLSTCTATANTIAGYSPPSGNNFNIIKDNPYIKGIILPGSVTSIGDYAFQRCTGLSSVTIPDSVTSIGNYAFYDCSGLSSVTIGESVTSIGYAAFYDCRGLSSVTIPGSVTSIGDYAFQRCTGLSIVTIPDSVTRIGNYAFYDCSGLSSVTIGVGVTSIGDSAFSSCNSLGSVTFTTGSNITTAWSEGTFISGSSLWTAYTTGSKAGTYTRSGSAWTQQ
jgi:hypothetical protein